MDGPLVTDPVGRMAADDCLSAAIKDVHKAAALIIRLQKEFTDSDTKIDFERVLSELQLTIMRAPQRIYISYGWLMMCTLLVNNS